MADFSDDMAQREQLLAQKLAEIGFQLAPGTRFLRLPDGSVGCELSGVWVDDSSVQKSAETADEFDQIMAAEQEHEAAERERKFVKDQERARKELEALANLGEIAEPDGSDDESDDPEIVEVDSLDLDALEAMLRDRDDGDE